MVKVKHARSLSDRDGNKRDAIIVGHAGVKIVCELRQSSRRRWIDVPAPIQSIVLAQHEFADAVMAAVTRDLPHLLRKKGKH